MIKEKKDLGFFIRASNRPAPYPKGYGLADSVAGSFLRQHGSIKNVWLARPFFKSLETLTLTFAK